MAVQIYWEKNITVVPNANLSLEPGKPMIPMNVRETLGDSRDLRRNPKAGTELGVEIEDTNVAFPTPADELALMPTPADDLAPMTRELASVAEEVWESAS